MVLEHNVVDGRRVVKINDKEMVRECGEGLGWGRGWREGVDDCGVLLIGVTLSESANFLKRNNTVT